MTLLIGRAEGFQYDLRGGFQYDLRGSFQYDLRGRMTTRRAERQQEMLHDQDVEGE
jgi:hypothetical protein